MKVYHGSPNKFDKFDYARIRTNGTSEGIGFYFTDNRKIAAGYGNNGYLYTVRLNGSKVLSDNEMTLTIEEVRKIVIKLHELNDYLSNYGDISFEGYEYLLNMALDSLYNYCDTDTEILGSLYNECGESEAVPALFHELLGYDYIVSNPEWASDKQTVYVALTNDIIDIIEVEKL